MKEQNPSSVASDNTTSVPKTKFGGPFIFR